MNTPQPDAIVVVRTPQGSQYDGRIGLVVDLYDQTILVRLVDPASPLHRTLVLPFGIGELEVIA